MIQRRRRGTNERDDNDWPKKNSSRNKWKKVDHLNCSVGTNLMYRAAGVEYEVCNTSVIYIMGSFFQIIIFSTSDADVFDVSPGDLIVAEVVNEEEHSGLLVKRKSPDSRGDEKRSKQI